MTDTLSHLDGQREVWDKKPLIRALYQHYHQLIHSYCAPGSLVEIGAGCGNLKSSVPAAISLDIINSSWVDLVADAQRLPIQSNSIDNIVMLDVLHHIPRPLAFLREAERVLKPGGRIVMLEPGISALSYWIYKYMHPEPVDLNVDVLADQAQSGEDPFDSNQAIPTLMFERHQHAVLQRCDQLTLVHREWIGSLSYPLSGGFRPWQMLTSNMLRLLLYIESCCPHWLRRFSAFRLLVVLERK